MQVNMMHQQMTFDFQRPHQVCIKNWLGKKVALDDSKQCFLKYGFAPGTILITPQQQHLEVIGIGKQDSLLWVKSLTGSKLGFAIENMHNQEDFIKNGYRWVTYVKKESNGCFIDDSQDVLTRIQMMYTNKVGCDVTFQVGDKQIQAHACFLRESSPYFRSILDGNYRESHSKIIQIEECESHQFELLLSYLYSGSIFIDEKNILSVAQIADRFCLNQLKAHCTQRLKSILKPDQALSYFHELVGTHFFLLPIIEDYIFHHLSLICREDRETIVNLSEETLLDLIQIASFEKRAPLFEVILNWVCHSDETQMLIRAEYLAKVISLFFPKKHSDFSCYATSLISFIHLPEHEQKIEKMLHDILKSPWILAILGEALRLKNQLIEAKEVFIKATALDPQSPFTLSRYGEVLRMLENFQEAKDMFEKALLIEPFDSFTLSRYGETLRQLGKFQDAKENFEKAIMNGPVDTFAFMQYRQTLYDLNKMQPPISRFRSVSI